MSNKRFESRQLRQLAEQILPDIVENWAISAADENDLITSLVRQWITYDGHATLFVDDRQFYLVLEHTPLGRSHVAVSHAPSRWMNSVIRDWKLTAEQWPGIIEQLNRGQSVEVVNGDGLALVLRVNPKEHLNAIEPLVKEPIPPGQKRNYRKIAGDLIEELFGAELEPEAIDELASSVVVQWQSFGGHAALFDEREQFSFTLTEQGNGCCNVTSVRGNFDLDQFLSSLSLPQDFIPAAIARINLGQRVEFRDPKGVPSVVWHDPKMRRFVVQSRTAGPAATARGASAIFCPKCGAVLSPHLGNVRHAKCPLCGHVVSPA